MATFTGTNGADILRETTYTGDTLVGRGGNDTYHCYASAWWDKGFPEYGIPGHSVYYRTDIVEELNRGYDTVYYHIGIPGILVSSAELPSIERIYLINNLGSQNTTFGLQLGGGAQEVFGSTLGETISGGAGNDTISGASGDDSLTGGGGTDSLQGGPGNDILNGGTEGDYIFGGTGDDTMDGGTGADYMAGGTGNDTYYFKTGTDNILEKPNEGKDTVLASSSAKLGANMEHLVLGTGNINGTGNANDNLIYAGSGNNVMAGGGGIDTVSFSPGTLRGVTVNLATGLATGASGSDTLIGFRNVVGTEYADNLQGNSAGNRLSSLGGNDSVNGGAGVDTLIGGHGDDVYTVDSSLDLIQENLNQGTDQILSTSGYSLAANIEQLQLEGTGNINGTGNSANNLLKGNAGSNVLVGLGGNDDLEGGDGNDTLIGGEGSDKFIGGSGADRFRVDVDNAGAGNVIWDFSSGVDKIDLSKIDANPNLAGDQAFTFDDLTYVAQTGIFSAHIGTYNVAVTLGYFSLFHPSSVLLSDVIL